MRNPDFVAGLQNAIARRDNAAAQTIIEAYVKDKKGDYAQFKNVLINSVVQHVESHAYYLQNPPSNSSCCSETQNTCGVILCCLSFSCLCSAEGSCLLAAVSAYASSLLFKCANEIEKEQKAYNRLAQNSTLANTAESLFKIRDDYCNRFPLKNQQPLYPITPSAPSL